MRNHRYLGGLLALVLALGLWGSQRPARVAACTPPVGGLPTFTTAEYVAASDVVLEGVVLEIQTYPEVWPDVATVLVQRYFKGSLEGAAVVKISGFGSTAVCLTPIQPGDVRIFWTTGDSSSGALNAMYMSQFDAAAAVSPERVQEIIAATGAEPFTPEGAPDLTMEEIVAMIGANFERQTQEAESAQYVTGVALTAAAPTQPVSGFQPIILDATALALGTGLPPSSTPTALVPLDQRYSAVQVGSNVALSIGVIALGVLVIGVGGGIWLGLRLGRR